MKKSIFLMTLLCFGNLSFAQGNGGDGSMNFGSLSKGCTGSLQICNISHESTGSVMGNFNYLPEEGVVLVHVRKEDMSEELLNHKGDELYFRQIESILIDPILGRKIGAMATLQIQKGKFLVSESKDGKKYVIHLIVKELD